MRGLNKVTLTVRRCDWQFRQGSRTPKLEGNVSVAKFSLANTETYKDDKGQTHSSTEWHNVVLSPLLPTAMNLPSCCMS